MAHESSHLNRSADGAEKLLGICPSDWPCALFRQRADLTFASVPPLLVAATGIPQAAWQNQPERWWSVVHEDDLDALRFSLAQTTPQTGPVLSTFRLRHAVTARPTYIREVRQAVNPVGSVDWTFEGLWLNGQLEHELDQRTAQALWSSNLSGVTRHLAHDFNNALTGILSLSDLFLTQLEQDHPMREGVGLIKQNAQRATQLVGRLTRLYQVKRRARAYHDLNELTRDVAQLLRLGLPHRLDVHEQLVPEALPVYLDAEAFTQGLVTTAMRCLGLFPETNSVTLSTANTRPTLGPGARELLSGPPDPIASVSLQLPLTSWMALSFSRSDPLWALLRLAQDYKAGVQVENHGVESPSLVRVTFPQADFTEADLERSQDLTRPRRLLLIARETPSPAALVAALRAVGLQVVTCCGDPRPVLVDPNETWDGIYLAGNTEARDWGNWVKLWRAHHPAGILILEQSINSPEAETVAKLPSDLTLTEETNDVEKAATIAAGLRSGQP